MDRPLRSAAEGCHGVSKIDSRLRLIGDVERTVTVYEPDMIDLAPAFAAVHASPSKDDGHLSQLSLHHPIQIAAEVNAEQVLGENKTETRSKMLFTLYDSH